MLPTRHSRIEFSSSMVNLLLRFMMIRCLAFSLLFCSLYSQVRAQGDALVQPTTIDSSAGVLDTTLTIQYATINGPFYTLTNTRLLNGVLPGPTLRVDPGDTMRILFQNTLTQQANTNFGNNQFTKPDHSNLHFHGGHVSGELPSDDVRMDVAPQSQYQYITEFPGNHMPGTHWIHPHVHGSSTLQVGGGAAGTLIVKDPANYLPTEISSAQDLLIFVQDLAIGELNQVINQINDQIFSVASTGSTDFRIVNGQYQPVVSMQPGEWQRWRVVHADGVRNRSSFGFKTMPVKCSSWRRMEFIFETIHVQ